jgi:uncharacterized membrane protein (DUF106 family)
MINTIYTILLIANIFSFYVSICDAALTDQEKAWIKEIVQKHLIAKLKDIYAISTRSRLGKRSVKSLLESLSY